MFKIIYAILNALPVEEIMKRSLSRLGGLVLDHTVEDARPLTVSIPRSCPQLCLAEDLTSMQLWWLCGFWLTFLLIMFPSMVAGKGSLGITGSRISLLALAAGIWLAIPHHLEVPANLEGLTMTIWIANQPL